MIIDEILRLDFSKLNLKSFDPLTPKRPCLFLAKKHIFKKRVIDENEGNVFRSQPYKLIVDHMVQILSHEAS